MNKFLLVGILVLIAGCGGVTGRDPASTNEKSYFGKTQFPSEKNTIYGAWESKASVNQGEMRLFFNRSNDVAVEAICDEGVGDVRASAFGKGQIDTSKVTWLQTLSGSANEKGFSCSLLVPNGNSPYNIQDNVLTIALPQVPSRTFTRLW